VGAIKKVTDADFAETVLDSGKPILVDFWADWCAPCHMIAPVLDEIAGEQDGIDIAKLNIDENPVTTATYQITSIPALKVFSSGQVVKHIVGAKPKAALMRDLAEFLA
jgi:thioredoxin 1